MSHSQKVTLALLGDPGLFQIFLSDRLTKTTQISGLLTLVASVATVHSIEYIVYAVIMPDILFATAFAKPQTAHDYTNPKLTWGHNIEILAIRDEGRTISCVLFGRNLNLGDFVTLSTTDGGTTRYMISGIERNHRVADYHSCRLTFAPRN